VLTRSRTWVDVDIALSSTGYWSRLSCPAVATGGGRVGTHPGRNAPAIDLQPIGNGRGGSLGSGVARGTAGEMRGREDSNLRRCNDRLQPVSFGHSDTDPQRARLAGRHPVRQWRDTLAHATF